MHLIRKEYRAATALLSVIGITLTALVFAFSPAENDESQVDSMFRPALNLTEVKSNPGAFLSVLQTARFMNAAKGNVTFTKPADPLDKINNTVVQQGNIVTSVKQQKLERLLAYHKVMSGSVITGGVQHYEVATAINHQPSSPTASSLQVKAKKAAIAQAALIDRENIIEKADTLL